MVANTTTGTTRVDPRSGSVTFDGVPMRSEPADRIDLNRLYLL
jgi:urease alpha subunit